MRPSTDLFEFAEICSQEVTPNRFSFAATVFEKVVIYDGERLLEGMRDPDAEKVLKSELYDCLYAGPGVFVVRGFYRDLEIVDRSSHVFSQIIADERVTFGTVGDHFAESGANERIWNSFQKVCERDVLTFIDYYKNPLFALVAESWLGPGYQITAQVNIVKPGGEAQTAHRDYHLGFQNEYTVARYPLATQIASQLLTLQGAIAHTDMPLESGPTMLLPFSQQYESGYLAYRRPKFKRFFTENAVQLPLKKGDALFFSPALFHAAGNNTTANDRSANLIQISSAFGRPMEHVDRYQLMKWCYDPLMKATEEGSISDLELQSVIAALADGYAFPTNLDILKPIGGAAPESAVQLMIRAVRENWKNDRFISEVNRHAKSRLATQ